MRSQIIIYGNHYLLRYCPSEHQIRGWMHFLAPWASIFDWFFSCSLVRVHHIKCATFWIACDSNLPFHDNLHGHIPFLSFDHFFSHSHPILSFTRTQNVHCSWYVSVSDTWERRNMHISSAIKKTLLSSSEFQDAHHIIHLAWLVSVQIERKRSAIY